MSAVPPSAENPAGPEAKPHRRGFVRRWLWPALLFLVTLMLVAHEYDWVVERINEADTLAAEKIGEVSDATLSAEAKERLKEALRQ